MPIFLFVVGTTLPLSLGKRVGQGQPLRPVYFRIVRRVAVLWACGMIIQYVRYWKYWSQPVVPEMYSNALQAIAIGYLVTSIALLHFSVRGQVALFVALLLGYWALLTFVPFGGYPAGTLLRNANFARYIDEKVLDVWRRDHDFTWVVSSLGFAASVLLGSFAGRILGGAIFSRPKTPLALLPWDRLPGRRVAVELLAPAESPPVDKLDGALGRRLGLFVGRGASRRRQRGENPQVGVPLRGHRRQCPGGLRSRPLRR